MRSVCVVQAIRDGVIEASINHEKGFVQSKETMDIYGTREPQLAFHQRISFCLDIHNMSVKVIHTHLKLVYFTCVWWDVTAFCLNAVLDKRYKSRIGVIVDAALNLLCLL